MYRETELVKCWKYDANQPKQWSSRLLAAETSQKGAALGEGKGNGESLVERGSGLQVGLEVAVVLRGYF